ncbi:MAG: hypothetical protein Q8941_10905 [Bacteroidota bacterium]|nr:hypothetical protein [Bacteroidota bacterium]
MKRFFIILALSCLCLVQTSSAQTNTKDFTTPGTYKFVVPKGITMLTVSLWGAGGWGGGGNGTGGKGGFVSGSVNVKEGETLLFIVGPGGTRGKEGGITAIRRDTANIAIAAAGGNGSSHGGRGGDGGPSGMGGTIGSGLFHSGNSGAGASMTNGGIGGSTSTGMNGKNGASLKGGTNNAKAIGEGWGGDGWFGGGAAATFESAMLSGDPYASGGGGGGSNYTKGLSGTITNSSKGSEGGVGSNSGVYGKISVSLGR